MWNEIRSVEERITTARHFRVFPGEGAHSDQVAELVTRPTNWAIWGDYSFEVFNDDYQQMPMERVCARAFRAAEWLAKMAVPLWSRRRIMRLKSYEQASANLSCRGATPEFSRGFKTIVITQIFFHFRAGARWILAATAGCQSLLLSRPGRGRIERGEKNFAFEVRTGRFGARQVVNYRRFRGICPFQGGESLIADGCIRLPKTLEFIDAILGGEAN